MREEIQNNLILTVLPVSLPVSVCKLSTCKSIKRDVLCKLSVIENIQVVLPVRLLVLIVW